MKRLMMILAACAMACGAGAWECTYGVCITNVTMTVDASNRAYTVTWENTFENHGDGSRVALTYYPYVGLDDYQTYNSARHSYSRTIKIDEIYKIYLGSAGYTTMWADSDTLYFMRDDYYRVLYKDGTILLTGPDAYQSYTIDPFVGVAPQENWMVQVWTEFVTDAGRTNYLLQASKSDKLVFEKATQDGYGANRTWLVLADARGSARRACEMTSALWARVADEQNGAEYVELRDADFTADEAKRLWRLYKAAGPWRDDGTVIVVK